MFFAYSGFKISRIAGLFTVALVTIFSGLPESVKAHLELYHNVEVNLTEAADTGVVSLYFTIHAPELLVGFEDAGSEIFDAEWLRARSDEEFQTLFEQGRIFVKEKFGFWIDSESELDLSGLLRFEKPGAIRDENYQSGVPVACLLVSAELKPATGAKQLRVKLKESAGKRLLLVATRKAAFPETNDMEAGDSVELWLPEIPAHELTEVAEASTSGIGFSRVLTLGITGLLTVVFLWRMNKMSR